MRLYLSICLGLAWFASVCHAADPGYTHGTVNILLANKNGLALVTDSRLSDPTGKPVGSSPKLFVVDDKTVVSIAAFYSASGPVINGKVPISTNVPGIMNIFLQSHWGTGKDPKQEITGARFNLLVYIYRSALEHLANQASVDRPLLTPSEAQLLMAHYEGKKLHVSQATLVPSLTRNVWEYQETDRTDVIVGNAVLIRLAGIRDVAENALGLSNQRFEPTDAKLTHFLSELHKDGGQNLSVGDLKLAAFDLKERTSRAHPQIVGGKTQFVTMQNGHITHRDLLPSPYSPDLGSLQGPLISGQTFNLMNSGGLVSAKTGETIRATFVDVAVNGGYVPLDGIAYVRSHFAKTTLTYQGKGPILFDPRNDVENTSLEVSDSVNPKDTALNAILKAFPSLKIVHLSSGSLERDEKIRKNMFDVEIPAEWPLHPKP